MLKRKAGSKDLVLDSGFRWDATSYDPHGEYWAGPMIGFLLFILLRSPRRTG